jgi:hypothetical protein
MVTDDVGIDDLIDLIDGLPPVQRNVSHILTLGFGFSEEAIRDALPS